MTINGKIIDEKLQHGINREAAKISVPLSGKTDKIDKIKELTDQIKSVYLIYYFTKKVMISIMVWNLLEKYNVVKQSKKKREKFRIYLSQI